MAYNQYDLANTSLVKTGILTEMYIPLWWYSQANCQTTGTSLNPGNSQYIPKGSTALVVNSNTTAKLHTLNSNWNSNQKFAFEASILTASGYTVNATLWDITANAQVSGSQISTTATSMTVMRSGQFTLIPSHTYGIALWGTGGTVYLSKASLIAFLG